MDIYAVANQMRMERKTIFDLPMRVTYYGRVSTTREEQENSIEHQMSYFSEMIQSNPNWTYVEGYVDRIRGESAVNRQEFMRMIEDGKDGRFDLILTKEVSRFARNTIDSLTYTRDLLRNGVGVFFQNDNICTIDTDSELRLTIMSSIAADEVRKLSERVRWGHKRSIEQGVVMGNSRIFGYDKNDKKLVINESEAEMVRFIFETYATGEYSTRKIEDMLYEKGYRGRSGTRIHHNTISGIIQNPKYKGYYCGNKVKIVDYRTKEQRFLPEDEWIMYKDETGDIVPAIVDEEIWERCNYIFKERSTAIKSRERSFKDKSVFTGKVWCKVHEKPYWRTNFSNSKSKGKQVYQWLCCEKRRFGVKSCESIAIMESDLYTMLGDYFKDIMENIEDYVNTFIQVYKETDKDAINERKIQSLKSQLEKERNRRNKLLELLEEDIITKAEFKERNGCQNVFISQLEEELHELENSAQDESQYFKDIQEVKKLFLDMYDPEMEMTKEQVDNLVKTLVDRIDVVPVSDTEMALELKLKVSTTVEKMAYIRNGLRYGARSGIILNMMIPKRQWTFTRINRRSFGHCDHILLTMEAGI